MGLIRPTESAALERPRFSIGSKEVVEQFFSDLLASADVRIDGDRPDFRNQSAQPGQRRVHEHLGG